MIEPEAQIALPASGSVVPEGVELFFVGVQSAQGVGPALAEDSAPRLARLRLHHRVLGRGSRREYVAIFRNDIPVAAQDDRTLFLEKLSRASFEPIHPP